MPGRVFAVVGPSGAGKDTLIAAAGAARPDLHIVRRVITRPAEAGGEPYEGVTEAEYLRRKAAGGFVLAWEAHGLCYGIPVGIDRARSEGRDVIFNCSRTMLPAAQSAFPDLTVIHVTASIPVLAERLARRGRETADEIAQRLTRATCEPAGGTGQRLVENDGPLDRAIAAFLAALSPERA